MTVGGPVRVLVVDDNPDHRTLIRLRLQHSGVEVCEAGSGEEALDRLDRVQLVLCDYQLPGMNGLEVLQAIRQRSDCSVIMVTGAGSESLVIHALRAGAVDYIVKDPGFLNALPLVVERAWRHHDLSQRAAELERLSLLVTSANDREQMLGGIVRGARRLLRADTCTLFLERDSGLAAEATDGTPLPEPGLLQARASAGADLLEEALEDHAPTRSLLVPMRTDDQVIGSLALVTERPRAYLAEEIQLARTFASFAAIALSNLYRIELQRRIVDNLQGLNDLRRDLLASVSHELRTPLTCIVGFSTTLGERWDRLTDAQRLQFVSQIRDHGHELTEQVNRLLDVAALESGRLTGTLHPVDLGSEVSETLALLAPMLQGREVDVDIPPLKVVADPSLLRRVLSNLLSNAVKYSPPGTAITVRATVHHRLAKLDVVDQGKGMSPDELTRAFEPFWRSSSALRDAARGAGVGLALVKEYMRVMRGDVSARSQPGMGSVFSITLPLDLVSNP